MQSIPYMPKKNVARKGKVLRTPPTTPDNGKGAKKHRKFSPSPTHWRFEIEVEAKREIESWQEWEATSTKQMDGECSGEDKQTMWINEDHKRRHLESDSKEGERNEDEWGVKEEGGGEEATSKEAAASSKVSIFFMRDHECWQIVCW